MLKIYLKLLQKYCPSAGWTLAELMIAAGMTLLVVMAAGFGLVTLLTENKVANATGEMQYHMNRATEFISEEIRNAKIIEHFARGDDVKPANLSNVKGYSPTFWEKYINGKGANAKVPILALKVEGVYERIIYYVDDVDDDDIWNGPGVIRRFGPSFKLDGSHDPLQKIDPSKWRSSALVDMMLTGLEPGQKQCRDLPPEVESPNIYIATDDQGMEWYRLPQAEADVKGFFICVREDKQLVQLNIKGSNVGEFKHLYGKDKENKEILAKETRYTEKMQYNVTTMVHARSEVLGSNGEFLPTFSILDGKIAFQEPGDVNMEVLHVEIPCEGDPSNTSNDVTTHFSITTVEDNLQGAVDGDGSSPPVPVPGNTQVTVKMSENTLCTTDVKVVLETTESDSVKFTTNDNSEHVTLNALIDDDLSQYSSIITKLESEGLIKSDGSGTYNFTLADNQILYFFEFGTEGGPPHFQPHEDPSTYDDAIVLVELTK